MRSALVAKKPTPNFLLWLAFPLVILIALGFAWRPISGGDDFWAHASIGRWILDHHRIPDHTLFLWSANTPWIAHAWGTGVVFALLMKLGGETGGPYLVLLLNMALSAAPFILLWTFWRRNAPYSSLMPVLFVVAIWDGAARYHPRPELFTALFLTLLLIFLSTWPNQKETPMGRVIGIMLMFAIWPNMHGAVAIGVVLLWITALAELLQTRGDIRLLTLAAVCTLIVFVCNPRGFEYYRVFLPIQSDTFKKIDEWKPFWKWPQLAPELVIGEFILWSAALILWASNSKRRLSQFLWAMLMFAAFISARRQLWLTAITCLAVLVSNAQHLQSDQQFRAWRKLTKGDVNQAIPEPMRLIARVGVLIILICAVCQSIPSDTFHKIPPAATEYRLPVHLSQFLLHKAPKGRIFNDYEYSAYLEWALHDKRKLYIDLNNAYPDSLMNEYFDTLASATNKKKMAAYELRRGQILDRRKIQIVSIRPYTTQEGLSILAKYLDKSPKWTVAYEGIDGTVWVRRKGH